MDSLVFDSHAAKAPATHEAARGSRRVAPAPPRLALYVPIHKALRALMADVLVALGRVDADDDAQTESTLARLRTLLDLCDVHLEAEQRFVHPAMEARAPGSSAASEREHAAHAEALARLSDAADAVRRTRGAARAAAALDLYRRAALFVADNFVHMHAEEVENQPVLEACYADDELEALHGRIVAWIPPQAMAAFAPWIAAANPAHG